ncbi:MAG TPA: hypothetical protein VEL28_06765 [Candidatus Binatia bacterium]|nr:hypothetical protein [Candidatus Binatia bacterium]
MADGKTLEITATLKDLVTARATAIRTALLGISTAITSPLRAAMGTLVSLRGILAGVGVALSARQFLDAGAAVEDYRSRLSALIDDEQRRERVLAALREIPARIPTEQAIDAFIQLEAIGTTAAEKVVRQLAGVSLIFQKDLGTTLSAVMSGSEKALRSLGVEVEKTGKKVILQSGDIRIETENTAKAMREGLLELWERRFPDAIERANQGFRGRMAELRDTVGNIAADVAAPLLPGIERFVKSANDWLQQHRDDFVVVAMAIDEIWTITLEHMKAAVDRTLLSTEFWGRMPGLAAGAFTDTAVAFAHALGIMTTRWELWVPGLVALWQLASSSILESVVLMVMGAGEALFALLGKLPSRLGGLFFQEVSKNLGTLGGWIRDWWGGFNEDLADGVVSAWSDAATAIRLELEAATNIRPPRPAMSTMTDNGEGQRAAGQSTLDGGPGYWEQISTAVAGSRAELERTRATLRSVGQDGTASFRDLATAAEAAGEKLKDALSAIDDRFAPRLDAANSIVERRKVELDILEKQEAAQHQIREASEAIRQAQLAEFAIEQQKLQAKLEVLVAEKSQTQEIQDRIVALREALGLIDAEMRSLRETELVPKSPWEAFIKGARDAKTDATDAIERYKELGKEAVDSLRNTFRDGFVSNMADLMNGVKSAGEAGKGMLLGMAQSLQEVILKIIATKLETLLLEQVWDRLSKFDWGKFLGNLAGAVVGGGTSSGGSSGSVAGVGGGAGAGMFPSFAMAGPTGGRMLSLGNSPARREAFMPADGTRGLSDARDGGVNVTFQITAFDSRSVEQMLVEKRALIEDIVAGAVSSKPNYRRRINRR